MLKWLSTKNAEQFGQELASMVIDNVPCTRDMVEAKRQSKSNYAKDKMQKRIRQFKQEEVLNFFKTAKLLNTFKWTLKDAGYDQEFIDRFAAWIFVGLRSNNF